MAESISTTVGANDMGEEKKKERKYTTISIPTDVINMVDMFIKDERFHGYKNRSDFCTEAIRLRTQELMQLYKDTFGH